MTDILSIIVSAMGIAIIINLILRRFHVPQIIGYIFTGTVIVYLFDLHQATHSHGLMQIAEFGIVFLMFMIGLEFSADKVQSMKREILLYGHTQVAITAVVFFLIAYYVFAIELKNAIIIANAIALSSTAIVLKSFKESKEIYTPHGKNVLGILIFQDIAVIPILLMITIMTVQDVSVPLLIAQTFISAVLILLFMLYPGRWLITNVLKKAADTKMDEIFVGAILFIVMGTAMIVHDVGFSYSLGAFMAGLIIAETKYKYQAEADLTHFRDLLLGVFFITVGMQINLEFLAANFLTVSGLLIGILLLKAVIIYGIIRIFHPRQNALKTGIALAQVGEFSFAIFELSRASGLLDPELHQILILVAVFSMILTPFILKNIHRIAELFVKTSIEEEVVEKVDMHNHVVVCGYGRFGKQVVEYLHVQGIDYIAVDNDRKRVDEGVQAEDRVIFGNITKKTIMEQVNIEEAGAVIVALSDPHKIRLVCESILGICEKSHIIVKVSNDDEMEVIADLNIHRVVNASVEVAKLLSEAAAFCDLPGHRRR